MATQNQAVMLTIANVKFINTDKTSLFIIETVEGIDLLRTPKQMLAEAVNIGIIDKSIATPQALLVAMKQMVTGTVRGTMRLWNAGDMYEVTATSRCVTDSKHPHYGKFKAGDKAPALEDGYAVDSLLDITAPESYYLMIETAKQRALLSLNAPTTPATTTFDSFLNRMKELQDARKGVVNTSNEPQDGTPDVNIVAELIGAKKAGK